MPSSTAETGCKIVFLTLFISLTFYPVTLQPVSTVPNAQRTTDLVLDRPGHCLLRPLHAGDPIRQSQVAQPGRRLDPDVEEHVLHHGAVVHGRREVTVVRAPRVALDGVEGFVEELLVGQRLVLAGRGSVDAMPVFTGIGN